MVSRNLLRTTDPQADKITAKGYGGEQSFENQRRFNLRSLCARVKLRGRSSGPFGQANGQSRGIAAPRPFRRGGCLRAMVAKTAYLLLLCIEDRDLTFRKIVHGSIP